MSDTITDDGSAPRTHMDKRFDNPDKDGTYPNRALPGSAEIHVNDPVKCGQWLDRLDLETRLRELGRYSSDEDRTKIIEALPVETRMKWINEEREHLEALTVDQPTEGADFGEVEKEVKVDGADEPQDRAPEVGAELIASLVQEKFTAEQKLSAETKRADDAKQLATERAAELDAYYKAFGPLPED